MCMKCIVEKHHGRLRRILETEHGSLIVVREGFCVPGPTDDSAQRLLGRCVVHVVLELVEEAALASDVRWPFIEHASNMRGQRYITQKLPRKDALALIQRRTCK